MELYNNWWEEMRSAYLYAIMAKHEKNILHKKLFLDLKKAAETQADMWKKKIVDTSKYPLTVFEPNMRTRFVAWLVSVIGTERMHFILSAMKIRGMSIYSKYHSEHRHTSLGSASNLRAAVFGINDGLVSNVSLILGIAGANSDQHFIVLAGVAGLLAGACSMGAGEYISVRSQREVFEYQIAIEKQELEEYPEEEIQELSLIYQARGIPQVEADRLSKIMIDNPETGLNTLAREELGLNPEELVSPTGAMIFSFASFAIGAAVPLLPFLISASTWNLTISITATGITLFLIGVLLSLFTNRNPFLQGARMLFVGVMAGGLTFLIGKWLGAVV